jgi:hypothetical protein
MGADGRWTHNRALGAFAGRLARLQVPTIAALNGLFPSDEIDGAVLGS